MKYSINRQKHIYPKYYNGKYTKSKHTKSKHTNLKYITDSFTLNNSSDNIGLDDIIHYLSIFRNVRNAHNAHNNSILFIKKTEFDIFYSCKYKYPLLVKETITLLTGTTEANHPAIKRRNIIDPFREDPDIPEKYRHTLDDYKKTLEIGLSMGHNAPAGQHKTNITAFSDTFLLSNITPQEIVLNSGLWGLIENWCKDLQNNKSLYNISIITGSIPALENTIYNGVTMNIPTKMFKIVCCYHIDNPDITYMDIIMVMNKPFYVNMNATHLSLAPFLVDNKSWKWFENYSRINLKNLLTFYNYNIKSTPLPLRNIISMISHISYNLSVLMKKSNWFGLLIYSKSIEELNAKWEACQLYLKKYDNDLSFHKEYYDSALSKLNREKKHKNNK